MIVKGKLKPLHDRVLVSDMDFGERVHKSGLILGSDNGKTQGIHPRWGKVWAVGPTQKDVKVGEWILIEHGRWTRKFEIENEDGTVTRIHGVDLNAMLMVADEKPDDIIFGN
jgi:co-chaperonin GroES (HSP10)